MNSTSDLYFASVLTYLQSQGHDRHLCLARIGYTDFIDLAQGSRVPLTHYQALLELGKTLNQDGLFGFHLGQDIRTADYGVLGYLIESSSNLASAIDSLLQYDTLVADIGTAKFSLTGDTASICWMPKQSCSAQVVLRNMTAWVAVVRQLVAPTLAPIRLQLTHSFSPEQIKQISEWFACPLMCNAPVNQIDFPHEYLKVQFSSDNPFMHQALKELSAKQLSDIQSKQSVTQRVQSILMSKSDLQGVNHERIAQALNLSPRTLQRKLKREDCTFAQLHDAERKRRFELLKHKHKLGDIAAQLGFNEQSSFNKAFKRWYACSPSSYLNSDQ